MAIYMKINEIEGHVTAKGYEKWIELNHLNFHVKRNIATHPGKVADREFTKPNISEIQLSKYIDKTSPKLFEQTCVGKSIAKIEIHICQTGVDQISPYMQYTLSNVIVSHYMLTAQEHCETSPPQENFNLNFNKLEMKYIPYDEKHNPGSPIPSGYDLSLGTKV